MLIQSLQGRLILGLLSVMLVAGLLAGALAYQQAFVQAEVMQDNALKLAASLIDIDDLAANGQAHWLTHPVDGEVFATRLPESGPAPLHLTPQVNTGFHTLEDRGITWRVFVLQRRALKLAVAQKTTLRDHTARVTALSALAPWLILMPLLGLISAALVRSQFNPMRQLGWQLAQAHDIPSQLPLIQAPTELQPFLNAISELLQREHALRDVQLRFLAAAAHELRSPLTALSLQAENLANATQLTQVKERLDILRAGLDRARRSAEQLLNHSRQQAAVSKVEPIDLSVFLADMLARMIPMAEQRGIELALDADDLPTLWGDAFSLDILLGNALDNALRYSPHDSEVSIWVESDEKEIRLHIMDNGPGIPDAEKFTVFQPFYRLVQSSEHGSGLGLAIVADAARRLGGWVSLHDRHPPPGLDFIYHHPISGHA
ncbi:MAG: HAMP domain-containing histidine kinase [Pseudomonadales bacterium]|nr:HAMP domain-containing histidine kinase [Pseudomonadales bacterium]